MSSFFSTYFYQEKKDEIAIKYADIGINIYENLNKTSEFSYQRLVYNKGMFYYSNGEYEESLKTFFNLIKLKNIKTTFIGITYRQIGKCYQKKGNFYRAMDYFRLARKFLLKYNSKSSLFSSDIGTVNTLILINTKKSITESLNLINETSKLVESSEKLKNSPAKCFLLDLAIGHTYSSLFDVYYKSDSLRKMYSSKAILHFRKVLYLAKKHNDSSKISSANLDLSNLYIKQGNDSAIHYLNQSLKYNLNDKYNRAITYNNIADYNLIINDLKSSIKYINKAINLSFNIDDNIIDYIPSDVNIYTHSDKKNIIIYFNNKADILINLYSQTNNIDFLKKAINTIKIVDRIVNIT
ncbi:tetratricopeptide repeat protein [Tenacibaculum skagerrakense]|uniref:Tetratricopeptide repeat protein n=1 Tax=Tenacibaculum skagerrakense TaxID=186571 RepID=A0A4R2NQQ3_9FLAO|nr:tetratricopeptide repeat protein [Tenacibaculum skagerrakense]TCP24209.1 tetratricopeptide repeat protein [Tenacibaculum skagerrakense]